MKAIIFGTHYQILTFLRVKKAVFFTFIFPCFIYTIFSMIWGNGEPEYYRFLISGIAMMVTTSDAIFSIGGVLIAYFTGGLSKFLKSIPNGFTKHITAMILSRLLIFAVALMIVLSIAAIKDGFLMSLIELVLLLSGSMVNAVVFSMVSIVVSVFVKDMSAYISILNIVMYAVLFLSDTFYPLTELNPTLGAATRFNPISSSLDFARNGNFPTIAIGWIVVCAVIMLIYSPAKRLNR